MKVLIAYNSVCKVKVCPRQIVSNIVLGKLFSSFLFLSSAPYCFIVISEALYAHSILYEFDLPPRVKLQCLHIQSNVLYMNNRVSQKTCPSLREYCSKAKQSQDGCTTKF